MIIDCSSCGKQYRIDASRLKGNVIKFTCKICHNKNEMVRVSENVLKHRSTIHQYKDQFSQKEKSNLIKPDTMTESKGFFPKTGYGDSKLESESTRPANTPLTFPSPEKNHSTETQRTSTRKTRKTHRFGLTPRVTIIMLLISITPLLILWLLNYQRMVSQIHGDTEALMLEAAEGLAEEMNEWVDVNVRIIYALSKMPAIISMDPAYQKPFLKIVKESYPWMYLVFTVGPDGMNIARSDDKQLVDYHDRSYVQGALKGSQLSWQHLIGRTSRKPTIVFSTPIRREGEIVGVMAVGITMDSMPKRIGSWRKGQTGYGVLLDENFKAISHKNEDYVIEEKIFDQDPLIIAYQEDRSQGLIQFRNSEGRPSVGVVKKTKLGWFLTVQQQSNEAFEILTQSKQYAILSVTATILIVVLIAWFSGKAITKPIKDITMAADRISMGDFDVTLNTNIKNEIGDLATSVIRMKECIRLSLKRLQKRRTTRQEKTFLSQVN
jgi:methyl-accepting chemotaxis protein